MHAPLPVPQLNIVASADVPDHEADGGPVDATGFPPATREVSHAAATDALLHAYAGWGADVRKLLACADAPTRWDINVVYPHLPSEKWTKGRVAILGDAVSVDGYLLCSMWDSLRRDRPTLCCRIWAQERAKGSKMRISLVNSSETQEQTCRMLRYVFIPLKDLSS